MKASQVTGQSSLTSFYASKPRDPSSSVMINLSCAACPSLNNMQLSQTSMLKYATPTRTSATPKTDMEWARESQPRIERDHNANRVIYYSSHIAIAIELALVPGILLQLRQLSTLERQSAQAIIQAVGHFPVAIAIKKQDAHYRNIPQSGYCTALVLDQLVHESPLGSIMQGQNRQRLQRSMNYLRVRCEQAELPQAVSSLQIYSDQLEATSSAMLDSKYWMMSDLLLPICTTLPQPIEIWTEDIASSAFPAGWMQLATPNECNRETHQLSPINIGRKV